MSETPTTETTVTEHLLYQQKKAPQATGHFTALFNDLVLSAKIIARSVSKAGLLDVLGGTGAINVQGENVQKLDTFADEVLLYRMERSGVLCAMASEEHADFVPVSAAFPRGDYMLIFDPLDGSSNIDANIDVGTIFSIQRRQPGHNGDITVEELLQPGRQQVAAGYFLYGPSTMLVYTTGQGVHGFTLDPSVGEFLLSHPNMQMPERGHIFSVNEGYSNRWDEPTRRAVESFKNSTAEHESYSARYVGSLVADFHRTLLYGGIYMYPPDARPGKSRGKLRYLCEAAPLALVAENAGGAATDGINRILDITPNTLHARTPLFIGSKKDVEDIAAFYRG